MDHDGKRRRRRFRFPFILKGRSHLGWRPDLPRYYYQIIDADGNLAFHGDPWSLVFLSSHMSSDLAAHEVIYVGRSTGVKHERNSFNRIAAHDKIQKIYADHFGRDYDIFISVLRIRDSSTVASL